MKPYLAVIADAFREALASRVLWLVLLGVLLFLAVLAPLGLRDEVTTQFKRFDVTSSQRLKSLLESSARSPRETATSHVVAAMNPDLQSRLRDSGKANVKRLRTHEILDELNLLLDSQDWYDAQLWEATTRLSELRELDSADADSLGAEQLRRRNRLRLEAALPGVFHPRSGDSVRLRYAIFDFPDAFVLTQTQFVEILNKIALPLIVNLLLGVLGVFIAILVTGSIIPEMFQSGSLQLLLSKPIGRSLLFLSKFLGGCSFVFVNITLMIVGLWLIVGFRLQIWNHNLLLCIPLFVFLFIVYYSVSAVAGLIWRNAIVSIAVTVIFWMACFLVGVTHEIFDQFVAQPATITQIARLDGELFATTHKGEVLRYAAAESQWQTILEAEFGSGTRALGPLAIPSSKQVLVAQIRGGRFNPFSGSNDALQLMVEQEDWKPIDGFNLPPGTREMFVRADGSLIVYGTRGISRADTTLEPEPTESPTGGMFAGLLAMLKSDTAGFTVISPSDLNLDTPMSVGGVPQSTSIVVYTRGRLIRLIAGADQKLTIDQETDLQGAANQRAAVAATANHVVLAREESGVEIYDLQTLEKILDVPLDVVGKPTALQVPDDGGDRVAILFADQTAKLFDTSTGQPLDVQVPHQGTLNSLLWLDSSTLLLAFDLDHVLSLDLSNGAVVADWQPARGFWRIVQDWFVRPLHTVFPKPGELGETVEGIVIGEREVASGPPSEVDLAYDRRILKIWQPLVNCGIFTIVMLGCGCLYVSRQDF
ncbi:ABC-2 family transporter protein [Rosistilla carotiformis]|uniref:ABC-2 family transporter protein n=1 Tax=Rosistilla carotiformis TaxID=2528017 RepID=A0A518JX73_9BACT|nr:ABC transporter permease [Rosistilla carotiformis]QDV70142.1 ABC-2 family transporter protein [Rosistilla carotiformis]